MIPWRRLSVSITMAASRGLCGGGEGVGVVRIIPALGGFFQPLLPGWDCIVKSLPDR